MRKTALTTMVIVMACALVIVAFTAIATAKSTDRPFKASLSGTCQVNLTEFTMEWSAIGNVTHLGLTRITGAHPLPPDPFPGTQYSGSATLVAADGDEVWIEYVGENPADYDPFADRGTVFESPGTFEITGGTGRFAHASGSGTMTAILVYPGWDGSFIEAWPATWPLSGTIGY